MRRTIFNLGCALIVLSISRMVESAQETLSICASDPFQSLRVCAAYCISWGWPKDHCDFIAVRLSCSNLGQGPGNIRNDCYCRPDLVPSAHSIISSCVNEQCSRNAFDLQQVLSVYDGYCSSAGECGQPRSSIP